MMELNGADHQLLVSHLAEAASHPSFGSMMALMTAEQDLEAGRSSHDLHQTAPGSHYMYYNDPYHAAAVFHSHLSGPDHHSHLPGPDHLSYDLAIVAVDAAQPAATAVPGACSHSCRGIDHGADDRHEKVEEEDQKLHLKGTSAAMMIGGECCRESEQVLQNAGSMPLYSQTCVEDGKGDSSAGVDMESSGAACRRKVFSESTCITSAALYDATKEKILAHPNYHRLLRAYINCRKVGAPPDVVKKLEELTEEYDNPQLITIVSKGGGSGAAAVPDPELDHFMETYCHVLHQYEEELSKPFNEAMAFLQKMEMQLNHISNGEYRSAQQGDGELRLTMEDKEQEQEEAEEEEDEEGGSCGEVDYEMDLSMDQQTEDKHIKDQLLRKYRGYISTLKHEFMKKKKKGKLPRDARQRLLDWWNEHYKWPYPSETEKATLAETTGLDQKQINNWFINQRKRHWKPSDQDMRYVMVNGQDPPMQDEKPPPA